MLALDGATDTNVSVGGTEVVETRPRHPMVAITSARDDIQKRVGSNRRGRRAIGLISKNCKSIRTAGECQESLRHLSVAQRQRVTPTEVRFSCQILMEGCSVDHGLRIHRVRDTKF